MSVEIRRQEKLNRTEIDTISEQIHAFLEKGPMERADRMRIRLTMEDLVLNVCETLGEDTPYTLEMGSLLGRKFIRFSYEGARYDPSELKEDPADNWSSRIMTDMGLTPSWRFQNGINTLELRLKRKSIGNIGWILIAIALSLILGFAGAATLSDSARAFVCELFFVPLQDIFLRLLSIFAGLMIFISLICGIFNIGDVTSFSKVGKNLFRRFIGFSFLLAAAEAVLFYLLLPSLHEAAHSQGLDASGISEVLNMIYDIVPKDPISPFMTGNAMQIVLMGFIVGVAILLLQGKMEHVKTVAEEINVLINDILTAVCKLLPIYLFFVLINMLWSGDFKLLLDIWKPFVIIIAINVLVFGGTLLFISVKYKVSVQLILKKLAPTALVCLTSASTIAAFGQTVDDCITKFGVDEKYVKFAHPIRCIIYMPGLITELIVMVFSMAKVYDMSINLTWVILGIILCTVLTIATPPIPGSVALVFGILFPQMGIPEEAMAFAVIIDVFYDFIDVLINNSIGILEYIIQADKLNMLDKHTLIR